MSSLPTKSSSRSCNGAVCLSDITVTGGFVSSCNIWLQGVTNVVRLGLPFRNRPQKIKVIKLVRKESYDTKGKSHLLHVGVNKEREYILNWMRNEYDNTNEGIWIALAKHIEEIKTSRYAVRRKKMTAQQKFFALVKKWA